MKELSTEAGSSTRPTNESNSDFSPVAYSKHR
jgi:hypothetical protein